MSVSAALTKGGALGIPFAIGEGAYNLQVRNITPSTFEVHFTPPPEKALTFYTAVASAKDFSLPDITGVIGQDGYVSDGDYVARFTGAVTSTSYIIVFRTYNATGIYEAPHLEVTTETSGAPTAVTGIITPMDLTPDQLIVAFVPSQPLGATSYTAQGVTAGIPVNPALRLYTINSTGFISGYDDTHDAVVFTGIGAAIPPGYANDDAWDITIRAVNSSGNTPAAPVQSQIVTAPAAPTAPVLGVLAKGSTTITCPVTGGVGADSWAASCIAQVGGQPAGKVTLTPPNAASPTGTLSITGLTPNSTFEITVEATNTLGTVAQAGAPTLVPTDQYPPKPVDRATIVPFGQQLVTEYWWCWKPVPGDSTHGAYDGFIANARIGTPSASAEELRAGVGSGFTNLPATNIYNPGTGPNQVPGYATAHWTNIPLEAQVPNRQVMLTVAQVNTTGESSTQTMSIPGKNDQLYPVPS